MRELGEIFEYNGRELVAMKSEEGCDGCYFNQRGQMACKYHQNDEIGPCGLAQRSDGTDCRFVLNGEHVRITRKPGEDERYWSIHVGSVHKGCRTADGRWMIEGVEVAAECVERLKVKITAGYFDGKKLYKRGETYDFVACDLENFTITDNGKEVKIPCQYAENCG